MSTSGERRKPGFYWVHVRGATVRSVGCWDGEVWDVCGIWAYPNNDYVTVLSPRLTPPKKAKKATR